ncbi:MAG: CpaF family protein, partial [Gammaproteobacteria bacterium]|nr:CpaF family protein [Gammaproteobacteria bacterium]
MFGRRDGNIAAVPRPRPQAVHIGTVVANPVSAPQGAEPEPKTEAKPVSNIVELAKGTIQPVILERIDPAEVGKMDRSELRAEIAKVVGEIAVEQKLKLNANEQQVVVTLLLHDMLGLGPLEPLLDDEAVTDIMVNGP